MTREEAISFGNMWLDLNEDAEESETYQFFKMAISALSENKGEWILVVDSYFKDGTIEENHWECSKCGSGRSGWGEFKFCPDCGADMGEPKGEKGEI